jgi:hypothetical protein
MVIKKIKHPVVMSNRGYQKKPKYLVLISNHGYQKNQYTWF